MKNWLRTIKEPLSEKKRKGAVAAEAFCRFYGKELLGESEVMNDIFYKIEKIAPTDANILILGENGTGKDLIAKAIHQNSFAANKAFYKSGCWRTHRIAF